MSENHNRQSVRLKGYDYTQPGAYFLTICLKDKVCQMATGSGESLRLNDIGKIAKKFWKSIPEHYPSVRIDTCVSMPDHMHGILWINEPNDGQCMDAPMGMNDSTGVDCLGVQFRCRGVQLNAPTMIAPAIIDNAIQSKSEYFRALSPRGCSLSVIIRNFKASVRKWCKDNNYSMFMWQRNFYERIIRNTEELEAIRNYIRNNPDALHKKMEEVSRRGVQSNALTSNALTSNASSSNAPTENARVTQ